MAINTGGGGTAKIDQALVNLQTSFDFKRIKQKDKAKTELIFREVISEIIVLSRPAIRQHPNIVELQGLRWDIPPDDKVRPVLVLEKSHFRDLCQFLRLPVGKDLLNNEKMQYVLEQRERAQEELEKIMEKIKTSKGKPLKATTCSVLVRKGYFSVIIYFQNYYEFEKLEKMKVRLRQEIADLELSIGDRQIVISLRERLATLYSRQGRWKEAEELEMQVMKTEKRLLGEEHPSTLISMINLASIYSDLG